MVPEETIYFFSLKKVFYVTNKGNIAGFSAFLKNRPGTSGISYPERFVLA